MSPIAISEDEAIRVLGFSVPKSTDDFDRMRKCGIKICCSGGQTEYYMVRRSVSSGGNSSNDESGK